MHVHHHCSHRVVCPIARRTRSTATRRMIWPIGWRAMPSTPSRRWIWMACSTVIPARAPISFTTFRQQVRQQQSEGGDAACQLVGCLVFMAFNSIKLVCASPLPLRNLSPRYIYLFIGLTVWLWFLLSVRLLCTRSRSPFAEGRNKHKQRRTVFARFLQGLRQSGDELNATEGMQLKVSSPYGANLQLSN